MLDLISVAIKERKILQERIDLLDSLINHYKGVSSLQLKPVNMNDGVLEIPKSFEEADTWRKKVLFGLSQCENQSGSVFDIMDKLSEYDPNIKKSNKAAFNQITTLSSKLKQNGIIKAKLVGNKNIYSMK